MYAAGDGTLVEEPAGVPDEPVVVMPEQVDERPVDDVTGEAGGPGLLLPLERAELRADVRRLGACRRVGAEHLHQAHLLGGYIHFHMQADAGLAHHGHRRVLRGGLPGGLVGKQFYLVQFGQRLQHGC